MSGSFTLSDWLGYASIGCWLGAQFPQVVENYRRKSCEGLALPFLANWLMGDISNLVGCLLTHQLPFQGYLKTWLATYFVTVDFMLVAQYFYYYKPSKMIAHYGHPRLSAAPATARRMSVDRGASRYRTLSTVAANVAAAAALAAQHEETHPGSARTLRPLAYGTDDIRAGTRSPRLLDDDEVDEPATAALTESFHSEGGRKLGRKLTYSIERHSRATSAGRYPPLPHPTTPSTLNIFPTDVLASEPLARGRPEEADEEAETPTTRRNSRASRSRRNSTMVFLGIWTLFGIGTLTNGNRGVPSSSVSVGRLLVPYELYDAGHIPVAVVDDPTPVDLIPVAAPLALREVEPFNTQDTEEPHHDPHQEEPPFERVLGRLFAWLCTTLYLTSRLPQIWKNYVRKSVEGLSMYLFVFAFLGNTFYVSSILFSPKASLPPPESAEFIQESIPYLLGSAGTLIFDMTIVTQSFLYRPKPRRHMLSTRSRMSMSEEEAGLLSADALHPPLSSGESAILNRGRTSRTRSVG